MQVVYAKAWVAGHAPKKKVVPRNTSRRPLEAGTSGPQPTSQDYSSAWQGSQPSDAESEEAPPPKPARPSSWQRRKAAKLRAAQQAGDSAAGVPAAGGCLASGGKLSLQIQLRDCQLGQARLSGG